MERIVIVTILFLTSCSISRNLYHTDLTHKKKDQTVRSSIANQANNYVGTKYRYGGLDKRGLDCSGLVFTVFKEHAISLPRSSSEQIKYGRKTTAREAKVGDLIFFKQKGKINHVAIVTEVRGTALWVTHSTTTRGVIRENLYDSPYWSTRIEGVRDIISSSSGK